MKKHLSTICSILLTCGLLLSVFSQAGCSDTAEDPQAEDGDGEIDGDGSELEDGDVPTDGDVMELDLEPEGAGDEDKDDTDAEEMMEEEEEVVTEGVPLLSSLGPAPVSSVLPETVIPCAVYMAEDCSEGKKLTCDIYEDSAGGWQADPDPSLEQMYLLDRYYDLYHRMEGQHSDLRFTRRMEPGTPESEWGDPQYFQEYDGYGDAAGWTGTVLQSAAARFSVTGTEADYQRMLETFETMMMLYEINEAPGMLIRSYYGMLEKDAPDPIGNPGRALTGFSDDDTGRYYYFRYPIAQRFLDKLPDYFTQGVEILGEHYDVTPLYQGDTSRDMYVRSLPGVMLAYDMLKNGPKETALKDLVKQEIPCTLKRMKKIRIRNLQQNEDILEAINAYFSNGTLQTEEGDPDLTKVDTIVAYMMEQPHADHMDKFDFDCPDTLPMEVDPQYDFDASTGAEFLINFLDFMNRVGNPGKVEQPIAWIQMPSLRGSDTLFMTQWALAGYYYSGDERFLEFLEGMMEELEYWPVINMMGSFFMPKWCRAHFGPSLLYPTLWNLASRVDKGTFPEYWNTLATAIKEELRYKELEQTNDSLFGIYYNNMTDQSIDPERDSYVAKMVSELKDLHQYQCMHTYELTEAQCKKEPLRNYAVDLLNDMPAGFESIETEELPQDQKDICLTGIEVFGVTIEGSMEDELPRAVEGLPLSFRVFGSFLWQMDPFMMYRDYGGESGKEAKVQWPGQGLSTAYWTARAQGLITEGQGAALGWRDSGELCEAGKK